MIFENICYCLPLILCGRSLTVPTQVLTETILGNDVLPGPMDYLQPLKWLLWKLIMAIVEKETPIVKNIWVKKGRFFNILFHNQWQSANLKGKSVGRRTCKCDMGKLVTLLKFTKLLHGFFSISFTTALSIWTVLAFTGLLMMAVDLLKYPVSKLVCENG